MTTKSQSVDTSQFFNAKPTYPVCPRCQTGKLVPLFIGEPACSEACERRDTLSPAALDRCFWATGTGLRFCLWEFEQDARYWSARVTCGLYAVEMLDDVKTPSFEMDAYTKRIHPKLVGRYSSDYGLKEVRVVKEYASLGGSNVLKAVP